MADDANGTPQQPERPKLRMAAQPADGTKASPSETIKVPPPPGAAGQRPTFGTLKPGAPPSTSDGRPKITLASGAPAEPPAVLSETATMKKKEAVTLPRPLASGALPTTPGQVAPLPDTAKMKKKESVIIEPSEVAPAPPTATTDAPQHSRLGPPKVVPDTARLTKKSSVIISGGTPSESNSDNEMTVRANMTSTSQMAAISAPPPDTARLVRKKADGTPIDPSRPTAAEAEAETVQSLKQTAEIVDPNMRRQTDTASLRRIVPKPAMAADGGPSTPNPEESTETIHLKVIKEKKNQLKNILSASQTIRLRPQSPETSAPAEMAQAIQAQMNPPPTESGDGNLGKKTLKIKAPDSGAAPVEDTRTANLGRSMSLIQKMRADAPAATTTPPSSEQAPSATQDGQGLHSPKSTLKIKAPPSSGQTVAAPAVADNAQPLDPNQKKSTLKIKAPAAGAAATVSAPAPGSVTAAAPTEAPKGSRTLKLKPAASRPGETMTAAAPGAGSTMAAPAPEVASANEALSRANDEQDAPGILYTLGAAATVVIGAGLLFFLITQAGTL